jgi:hypothetical protein
MDKSYYSVASDMQRAMLMQTAMRRAGDVARESFYHGLVTDDLGDEELLLFADDAWERFTVQVVFDYPGYACALFRRAYLVAYRAFSTDLPHGRRPDTHALAASLEDEIHQAHGQI